ncbi:glycosyltransferase family 4 protein [Granulicella cerasi]|uniref:Glycosyltransferase family 4 protein n=1 Tax=Granulicella cerasi TaxID=741063 RepID=A0ABW1ZAW7_9BACT|nr:glycosyltransferase family 4 protein [Granulicella cerasi]
MVSRVIIVAEHASVRFGGEASLPYHYFRVLRARGVDALLITHERTRTELEELFPHDRERLLFVPDMAAQKLFFRLSSFLPRRIAEATFGLANQLLTQHAQRKMVRELAAPGTVVHQPIPVSPKFPSLIANVGAPVIIGPMNGGMEYPPAFRRAEFASVNAAIALGRSFSGIFNRLLPGKQKAARLLVANPRTAAALPVEHRGRVVEIVENGVDLAKWPEASAYEAPATPRFLFMGRLVDWKALDLVLLAMVRVPQAELDVVGDGNMRAAWEQLARELNIGDRVHFHGWKSQAECAQMLQHSTALVLPSIYECGGAVVLEAMSVGRPVIATAWGGPADYLDTSCGILVEPTSRTAMIEGFADALEELARSPELCATLGRAARQRIVDHFDWEKKVDRVYALYEQVLAEQRR